MDVDEAGGAGLEPEARIFKRIDRKRGAEWRAGTALRR